MPSSFDPSIVCLQHVRQQTLEEYHESSDAVDPAWPQLHKAQQQVTAAKRLHRQRSMELLQRMEGSATSLEDDLGTGKDTRPETEVDPAGQGSRGDRRPVLELEQQVLELERLCSQLLLEVGKG